MPKLWFDIRYRQYANKDLKYTFISWINRRHVQLLVMLPLIYLIFYLWADNTLEFDFTKVVFPSILTIIFVIIWDLYNKSNKEKLYFNAFLNEIRDNIEYLHANIEVLNFENKHSKFHHEVVFPFQFDIWDSFKLNFGLNILKMDIGEIQTFYYDFRRFNKILSVRDNMDIRLIQDQFKDRKEYNERLLNLARTGKEHLFNALSKRGKVLECTLTETSKSQLYLYLMENEFNLTLEMENDIEQAYKDKAEKLIFYQYLDEYSLNGLFKLFLD